VHDPRQIDRLVKAMDSLWGGILGLPRQFVGEGCADCSAACSDCFRFETVRVEA